MHPSSNPASLQACGAEIFKGDITVPASLQDSCAGIQAVCHCAGIIRHRKAALFYKINTQGTIHLAQEVIRNNVERFIYVSSSSAGTGSHTGCPLTEKDAVKPYLDYGRSKILAEEAPLDFHRQDRIEAVIIRPPLALWRGRS